MESALVGLEQVLGTISGFLWGKVLWVAILAVGVYLTWRLRCMPWRKLGFGFRSLWQGRSGDDSQGIAPFSALMVSLSATIGTGNIAGVATAIGIGGPGALFWMWCSALVGMATKYTEAVCAVHYREKNAEGRYVGGPMYYIKNGLHARWYWLALAFALFGALAGFGIGNMVQAHSVADVLEQSFNIDRSWLALVLMMLVGLVLLGGINSIARVARKLVPIMAIFYLMAGLVVILVHLPELPNALYLVVQSAFTGTAAQGGFAGALVALAIERGIARGVFSNEAGLGSAPIAHAAAHTDSPVRQGSVAMLGTFIDTLIVCSITGLAIIVTGVWTADAQGALMSQAAFASVLPWGDKVVAISLSLFAFTTILGWSYYGERCAEFLLGNRIKYVYRTLWVIVVPLGVLASLELVWAFSDVLNGLMAIPNLIALVALSGVVARMTQKYFQANSG